MLLVAVGIHSFLKITFTWLQHFLWQYLHLHGGKNTMLLHLLLIAKLQNKTRYHKNIKSLSYYITKRYFAIAFVFCITFNFGFILISANLFVRGAKFKRAPFVFRKKIFCYYQKHSLYQFPLNLERFVYTPVAQGGCYLTFMWIYIICR